MHSAGVKPAWPPSPFDRALFALLLVVLVVFAALAHAQASVPGPVLELPPLDEVVGTRATNDADRQAYSMAGQLLAAGEVLDAANAVSSLASSLESSVLFLVAGRLFVRGGALAEAEQAAAQAGPGTHGGAEVLLAGIYALTGRYDQASSLVEVVLADGPAPQVEANARLIRAELALSAGQPRSALVDLEAIGSRSSGSPAVAWLLRAIAHAQLAQLGPAERALAMAQRRLQAEGLTSSSLSCAAAEVRWLAGDRIDAVEQQRECVNTRTGHPGTVGNAASLLRLAEFLLGVGDHAKAETVLARAEDSFLASENAIGNLRVLAVRAQRSEAIGDTAAAINEATRARDGLDAANRGFEALEVSALLGHLYRESGDCRAAVATLQGVPEGLAMQGLDTQAAPAFLTLGECLMALDESGAAGPILETGFQAATRAGAAPLASLIESRSRAAAAQSGKRQEAEAGLSGIDRRLRQSGQGAAMVRLYNDLATVAMAELDFEGAIRHLRRGITISQSTGDAAIEEILRTNLAVALARSGAVSAGTSVASAAGVEDSSSVGEIQRQLDRRELARLAENGAWDDVVAALEALPENTFGNAEFDVFASRLYLAAAQDSRQRGNPTQTLLRAGASAEVCPQGLGPRETGLRHDLLAGAYSLLESPEAARDSFVAAVSAYHQAEEPLAEGTARYNLAGVLNQLGGEGAEAELRAAVQLLDGLLPEPPVLGQAALQLGALLLRKGDREGARNSLLQAREVFLALELSQREADANALLRAVEER